jgi:hypothetical protein
VFVTRPTGVNRTAAIDIRIPIDGAAEWLVEGASA